MSGRGFAVHALGMRWWVDTTAIPASVHDVLARLWSRAADDGECRPTPEGDAHEATFTLVTTDADHAPVPGHRIVESGDRIPYGVSRALTLATLQRRRGTMLLLHAAGLTVPGGSEALVLVAGSGTGKSTAAHHLAGTWGYLSDESIGITAAHEVHGHPKPVSLIADPSDPSHKIETSPDDAGYALAPCNPTLGAVVLLRRDPERTAPAALGTAPLVDAMVSVISQTSSIYLLEHPLDALARVLCERGGPHVLDYREISDCDHLLAGLLAADSGVTTTWVHLPPGPGQRASDPGAPAADPQPELPPPAVTAATRVRRRAWTDAVRTDDELLLLVRDRPYRLAGVGHALWLALDRPRTLDELVDEVVAELGEHPEARSLTAAAVEQLHAQGIVEVTSPLASA